MCRQGLSNCTCGGSNGERIEDRGEDEASEASSAELLSDSGDSEAEESMEQEDGEGDGEDKEVSRAGVAVRADLARTGPRTREGRQQGRSKGADVAVRADLARAGPPKQKVTLRALSQADPPGSSLEGSSVVPESGQSGGSNGPGEGQELPRARDRWPGGARPVMHHCL